MLVVAGVDKSAVACIRIGKMRGARSVPRCVRIGSQSGWFGDAGIHCVVCPGAGFVRIGSYSDGLMVGIGPLVGPKASLCEDSFARRRSVWPVNRTAGI